ncbi:MAG: agmatine deiminase [Oscillospiraceae bacterium]|nr:agmatine deiminase [Oscillospiraceae bacterium]
MRNPEHDGYYMPGEFAPHAATVMIFPERPGSWPYGAAPAMPSFVKIWESILADELLYLVVSPEKLGACREILRNAGLLDRVTLLTIPQNDAWARDTCPTFVVQPETGDVAGVDWRFNAWGGEVDGLYADYAEDNALASVLCHNLGYGRFDAQDFVLEGGSVHSDGEGTLLVTEACLLSEGRNPSLSRAQIGERLCRYLGAEKVLWLPRGIYNDETNEHVDNVCAFLRPGEAVLAWTDDKTDPQYAMSAADLAYLESVTDAKGRRLTVHKLPVPAHPVCITQHDLDGFTFAPGEDEREAGERLAASYVNFYFTNHSVLLPQFGGENAQSDALAVKLMQQWCPERKVIPVPARELIVGGGNIHCLTQQIPAGKTHA